MNDAARGGLPRFPRLPAHCERGHSRIRSPRPVKAGTEPLVLVHGGFSNHHTNWELVRPLFEWQFTVYALARRGRGETDATEGQAVSRVLLSPG